MSLEDNFNSEKASLKDILADKRILADQQLMQEEEVKRLFDCIQRLDSKDKYLLEMHIYRGVQLRDLLPSLGISRSAVDMRKARLIQKLKECFKSKGFQLDS